ncbi:MAG: YggT family protein [Actinomycetota bacterium]|jgi:YggT family protein|nr:YggT family protein [Actinomycetota bacterium]
MRTWATHPLYTLGMIYLLLMLLRAVLSWFPIEPGSMASRARHWLTVVTEPVIAPFRKIIPPVGIFDLSFLIAFLVVYVVTSYLLSLVVI